MTIEPWVIQRAGDAHDRGALVRKELDCDRPDPARSGGDHDNITGPRLDRRVAAQAVAPTTNNAPATSHETPGGRGVSWAASTATNSAWLARCVNPIISSPTATPRTSHDSSTTPARSLPCPDGNSAGSVPEALADLALTGIDARGLHTDEDLAGPRSLGGEPRQPATHRCRRTRRIELPSARHPPLLVGTRPGHWSTMHQPAASNLTYARKPWRPASPMSGVEVDGARYALA